MVPEGTMPRSPHGSPEAPEDGAAEPPFAPDGLCLHKGGALSQGIVQGRSVTCTMHNGVVDLGSGQAQAPDIGCVQRRPVRIEGDRVLIALRTA